MKEQILQLYYFMIVIILYSLMKEAIIRMLMCLKLCSTAMLQKIRLDYTIQINNYAQKMHENATIAKPVDKGNLVKTRKKHYCDPSESD
jgi:hypothetical protein